MESSLMAGQGAGLGRGGRAGCCSPPGAAGISGSPALRNGTVLSETQEVAGGTSDEKRSWRLNMLLAAITVSQQNTENSH